MPRARITLARAWARAPVAAGGDTKKNKEVAGVEDMIALASALELSELDGKKDKQDVMS